MDTKEIYPVELTLKKANTNNEHCPLSILIYRIINGKLNTKIYDKREDFSFPIIQYPFLDGDVPLSPSYGVYIFRLVRIARVCNNYFSARNVCITEEYYTRVFDITNQSKHLLNFR